jgi:hypothetical protein
MDNVDTAVGSEVETEELSTEDRSAKVKEYFDWLETAFQYPESDDDFRQFVEIVDGKRPSGYKVFSRD